MNSLLIAALAVLASPTLTMAKTQAAPAAPAPAMQTAPGPQGAPGMPRHVLQETAFRRPSVPAGAGAGAGRATADGGCCEDGVIVGTVGMSLGDAWADRDLGADHVHAQDAPAPDFIVRPAIAGDELTCACRPC